MREGEIDLIVGTTCTYVLEVVGGDVGVIGDELSYGRRCQYGSRIIGD